MSSKSEFEFKSYFPKYQLEFSFGNWLVEDGSYVKEGDNIYTYSNSILANSGFIPFGSKTNQVVSTHKAEKSGYIDIYFSRKGLHIPKNEMMYVIREKDNERIDRKYINTPRVIIDEFNNSKNIV